jgi:hypothetical protein
MGDGLLVVQVLEVVEVVEIVKIVEAFTAAHKDRSSVERITNNDTACCCLSSVL